MKKIIILAAFAASLFNHTAQAEVIDVSTIKCSEIGTMKQDEASYLFMWLHGYFGGQVGDTTIDLGAMEDAGKAIGEKCAANPDLGLMTAIQQLGQ